MKILIEVNFASPLKLKELNKKWRRKSYTPKVLSFYYGDRDKDGNISLGEVLVNREHQKDQKELIGHGVRNLLRDWKVAGGR